MNAKSHYENHLASFYSWMVGDFETKVKEHITFLKSQNIQPSTSKVAFDLGAAHGIQSKALAQLGFSVKALDFNKQLLGELEANCEGLDVSIYEEDILAIGRYANLKPEIIMCWGDTLTHLESESRIETFIEQCADTLDTGGKLILSFRDYSEKIAGDKRFIPVKNDSTRILTCFLEYLPTHVMVTDLLYEWKDGQWKQKISSYAKVRISLEEVLDMLTSNQLNVTHNEIYKGTVTMVAVKG